MLLPKLIGGCKGIVDDEALPAAGRIPDEAQAGLEAELLCWPTSASCETADGPAESKSISSEVSSRLLVILT